MTWHPLVKIDRVGATADSNQEDMECIRALPDGLERDNKIDAMIEANVPLVKAIVEKYIGLHSGVAFLFDDLISEGLLALISAVKKLSGMDTPEDGGNCTGFISARIIWAICDLMDQQARQIIPEDYTPPYPVSFDPMEEFELRDLLAEACQTPEDCIILEMREAGSTDQEIADRLSIPRRAVNYMRHEILQRYDVLKQKLES
jgi:DNA-directed RNA polymerase specialized sigma24 family protein